MVRTLVAIGLAGGLAVPLLALPLAAVAGPTPTATELGCGGETATIIGTAGDDRITGTRGPDVIVGRGGDDRILGLAGDDVVCGNTGADDLDGGRGHDTLYGGQDDHEQRGRRTVVRGDLLRGGPGDDHLSVGFDPAPGRTAIHRRNIVSFRHSSRAVSVDLRDAAASGEGTDVVVAGRHLEIAGSRYDDVLLGSRRPETLDGGRGDDQVSGAGGRDAVLGYHGNDVLEGGNGPDLVISTAGATTLDGGDDADWLIGGSPARSTLLGGSGFDYLSRHITVGDVGTIDGGPDADQLELTTQLWFDRDLAETLDAGAGTAVLTAGEDTHTTTFSSIDYFTLWGTSWTFLGTGAPDFVQVVGGRMDARGLGGDDYLLGGDRPDVLDGGDGTDTAWGGRGRNTCTDTEVGSCTGYPWDRETPSSARVITGTGTGTADVPALVEAPRTLLTRWWNHRDPVPGR